MIEMVEEKAVDGQTQQSEQNQLVETEVKKLVVKDQETFDAAGAYCRRIDKIMKDRIEFFAPMKKSAYDNWKIVCKQETDSLAPLKLAKTDVEARRADWLEEQERLAAEAKAKADAEQKKREAERQRQIEEAEAERQRKLDEAQAAEEAGKKEEADQLIEEAAEAEAAPEPEPDPEPIKPTVEAPKKSEGVSMIKVYKARVIDKSALIRGVAEGKIPLNVIKIDDGQLNKLARAMEDEMKYPGVEVYTERQSRYRKEKT